MGAEGITNWGRFRDYKTEQMVTNQARDYKTRQKDYKNDYKSEQGLQIGAGITSQCRTLSNSNFLIYLAKYFCLLLKSPDLIFQLLFLRKQCK